MQPPCFHGSCCYHSTLSTPASNGFGAIRVHHISSSRQHRNNNLTKNYGQHQHHHYHHHPCPPTQGATVADLYQPRTTMTTTTTMTPHPPHCHPADRHVITIRYHTPVTSWPKGRRTDTPRRRHHRFVGLAGKSSVEDRGCVVGKGRADRTMNLSRTSVGTRTTGPLFPPTAPRDDKIQAHTSSVITVVLLSTMR